MTAAIEARGVTKTFGTKLALDKLTMSVPEGSVYGLVGPNGAGKSTILNHLAGAYRPDAGEVLALGQPIFDNTAIKERISYIPTSFYYYNQATIQDMRDLYAAVSPRFSSERFDELADAFGMDTHLHVRSLSHGMRKQVAFWLALSQDTDILLLDEPFDGLDPAARHRVWGMVMDKVADRGMTVLVSSHNLRELTDVCDWVGIMVAGHMHLERSLCELQENFVKVQVAWADGVCRMPRGIDVLNHEVQGRLSTLVASTSPARAQAALRAMDPAPLFVNVLPLSLEEIFIYELGGDRRVKEILD